ncbi:sialidase family protein [Sunxiuqinia elliptica]|nr:hypothetical protein [Sunxiuqinia elliptica]
MIRFFVTRRITMLCGPGLILAFLCLATCTNTNQTLTENEDSWVRIGPGGGGSTFIPTFSYHTADEFIVRCDMTGSYLTEDGGESYSQVNVPNGATAYAYDPTNRETIYLGSNKLIRSKDGGNTWEQIFPPREDVVEEYFLGDHANYHLRTKLSETDNADNSRIQMIRIDPVRPENIYLGKGDRFICSFNAGKSWHEIPLDAPLIYSYASQTGDEVYLFTHKSLFVFNRNDKSLTSNVLPEGMSPIASVTGGVKAEDGKVVFYSLHQRESTQNEFAPTDVFFTEDFGVSWNRIDSPLITNEEGGEVPSYSQIACAENDAAKVYLIANRYLSEEENGTRKFWYGAIASADAGEHWNWVWKGGGGSGQYGIKDGLDAENLNDAWVKEAFGGEYIRLIDVGVYPKDGNVAIVTDWYRTMKTMDGGKSWKEVYSQPHEDKTYTSRGMDVTTSYGVHFDPWDSSHLALSFTDIGFHHSYNEGESWKRSVAGVPGRWVNTCYWMVFDPSVRGKVWSAWSSMHDFPRGKMTRSPKWKEHAQGGVCLSVDGGGSWEPLIEGMGSDSPVTSILLDPFSRPNHRTLYASVYSKGVYKSTDDGHSWTIMNQGIENPTGSFELSLSENGDLFLVVCPTPKHSDGKLRRAYSQGAVYKSVNGAETWEQLRVTEQAIFANGIAVDPLNPDRLYLACWSDIFLSDLIGADVARETGGNELIDMAGGVWTSADGGKTWEQLLDNDLYVYDVTVDPYHPGRLYCCTFNQAAYRSDDYGQSWKKIKGYDFHWGHRVVIDENDLDKIYITTFGSSVWHGLSATE